MEATAEKHEMRVMSAMHGDLKVIWDPEKADEVQAAREQFDTMVGKGYAAFRVDEDGEKSEQIRHFDPNAKAIILAPQLRGG